MALHLPNTTFYHIPKTGGIWCTKLLQEWLGDRAVIFGLQHGTPAQVIQSWVRHPNPCVPDPRDNYSLFVIRKPTSWLESYWRYRTGEAGPGPWKHFYDPHITAAIDDCGHPDFNQYVKNYLERLPGCITQMYQAFAAGPSPVWVKQESLQAAFVPTVGRLTGVTSPAPSLPKENVSMGPRVEWDPKLYDQVQRAEEWSYNYFGYEK